MKYIQRGLIAILKQKGIFSGTVLEAISAVPRHLFVSEALRYHAYDDISLPIGFGQTVSKPSVIAKMVQALQLTGEERVLEIGTGSGYQSAIISLLARSLVTMERIEELFNRARTVLHRLQYTNVRCIHSDDFNDAAGSFDAVIVSAGTEAIPTTLFRKVSTGGTLIIPVGSGTGHRIKKFIKKDSGEVMEEDIGEAVFVPYISSESACMRF
jgi:protein-L-isoaspartate(D-aspartate) O-methyltransferase